MVSCYRWFPHKPTPWVAMSRLTVTDAWLCGGCAFDGGFIYRFLTSEAHPSIPSPRLPFLTSSVTPSMPCVLSRNASATIPPAFARFSGMSSSIGVRNPAIRLLSSAEKWYFSPRTSARAQCRSLEMLRSSPLRLKISCDHLPERQRDFGKGPRSSMICAI